MTSKIVKLLEIKTIYILFRIFEQNYIQIKIRIMFKKITILSLMFIVLINSYLRADEGMWIPLLLQKYNIEDMQKKGFKLTAEDIYSINQASMKDAVMIFDGGCTAELISDKGLIITNHHCGFSQIQDHSSLENDYLTDGFWAASHDEELPNKGLTVTFLVRMEDVTAQVLAGVADDGEESVRQAAIDKNIEKIKEEAVKGTHFQAEVKAFFYGNQYFLFVQEEFLDVRFVGAPPSAIGKFGGDTDNWMWPRHTGDFSLFRIYADKDNKPAEYSENNVPFTPKKHFTISMKGTQPGDFTMVFGYPGNTEEYLTSYAVDMIQTKINPYRIEIRQTSIDLMLADMEKSPAVRIQYADKHASVSNAWKKWIGENNGLKRLDAVNVKKQREATLTQWINQDETRKQKYAYILPEFEKIYADYAQYSFAEEYFYEAIWRMESVKMATRMRYLVEKGSEFKPEDVEKIRTSAKNFFKDYNLETDKKIFKALLSLYVTNVDKRFQPEFSTFVKSKYLDLSDPKKLDAYVDFYFEKTFFLHEDQLMKFFDTYAKADYKKLENAPAYQFYTNFMNMYVAQIMPVVKSYDQKIANLNRFYMRALMEADSAKIFYPDANFTLRVTYGKVADYEPKDGIKYKHYTTVDGIIEKDNPDIYDYRVPQRLKDLYAAKDYGDYAENGELHTCFIATNHTTGGNSGSPVLNANGELIGVNFDRCWEGTMSDIMYDPAQCRNISLDIRYALFLIDKFAGASYLLDEMIIVK